MTTTRTRPKPKPATARTTCANCATRRPCLAPANTPDGGWVCPGAAHLFDAPSAPPEPRSGAEGPGEHSSSASRGSTTAVSAVASMQEATTWSTSRALAAIAESRCPCCDGALGSSDYPSWKVCTECGCQHMPSEHAGRLYHATVVGAQCRRRKEER